MTLDTFGFLLFGTIAVSFIIYMVAGIING